MKKLIYHIVRLALVLIPAVLTVAPAMAQKPVQHIVVNQHDTIEFSVVDMPGDEYTWDLYTDSTINFAEENQHLEPVNYFVDGDYRDSSSVQITNLEAGIYFLRVMAWDEVNCTNNLVVFKLEVLGIPKAEIYDAEACFGDPTYLRIVLTGVGPWEFYLTDNPGEEPDMLNLIGTTQNETIITITPDMYIDSNTPSNTMFVKEYWINYIKDLGTGGINEEPMGPAKVIIYPKPSSDSGIYIKQPENEED